MVDIIFHVLPTAIDDTTCLCETPANLRAQTKLGTHSEEPGPDGAGSNSAAWASVLAMACCLLVTLLILLLRATLHIVTSWHGRFLRLFLRITVLRPCTVDRTCPVHDRGSAGASQGNPTSSFALMQPASALQDTAGRRRNIDGKRPGDDGSDAEDNNDRGKRPRVVSDNHTKLSVVCPFRARDPNNPKYFTCGVFHTWSRLREHLLDRKHKPRDRCPICGQIFTDGVEWDLHTSARACERSPQPLESPFWVERHQAASIRDLSRRGRSTGSMEEMYREVWAILFGSESGPDHTAWAHPTWSSSPRGDLGVDHGRQERWDILKRTTGTLLGMQNVPRDDSMQRVIDCILFYHRQQREHTHDVVSSQEPEAGEAAADEQQGCNEAIDEDWMPPGPPTDGQAYRISEPDRYTAEGSEGELEHSLSIVSTYLSEGASNPSPLISLDSAQTSSVCHQFDSLDCGPEFVNPVLLQRTDAHMHHIHMPAPNDNSNSTALHSASAASQASEATVPGSSLGHGVHGGELYDDLDDFDFSVPEFDPDLGSI